MRNPANTAYQVCCSLAILTLACGFALARIWPGVIASSVFGLVWILTHRFRIRWLAPVRLVISIGIAGWGLLTDVSQFLLIAGVTASLACWELDEESTGAASNHYEDAGAALHLTWLLKATAIGLIISEAALFLTVKPGFGIVAAIVLLILFGFVRLFSILKRPISKE